MPIPWRVLDDETQNRLVEKGEKIVLGWTNFLHTILMDQGPNYCTKYLVDRQVYLANSNFDS